MTDGQRDLFGFVGAAFAVMIGLFTLQAWYGSFVDVRAHEGLSDAAPNPEVAAVRAAEAQKLAAARMPIEQAMREIGRRGRSGFPSVAPTPSDDLSAMSGWIHGRKFTPYVPRTARVPTTPVAAVDVVPAMPIEAAPEAALVEAAQEAGAQE